MHRIKVYVPQFPIGVGFQNYESNNDPYVKYEVEKEFADTIATEQICIPNAGHINSESGFDTFENIVSFL